MLNRSKYAILAQYAHAGINHHGNPQSDATDKDFCGFCVSGGKSRVEYSVATTNLLGEFSLINTGKGWTH